MTSTLLEGPLSKWTNVMKGWQYRWFVLDDNAGLLSYYTSREKMMKGARRGCVRLRNAIIGIDDEDDSTFTITVDQKVFHFQARHAEERKQWATALEETIRRHSQLNHSVLTKQDFNNFDKRLAEADAYLQLMLTSVNQLQGKMDRLGAGQEKDNVSHIITTAREMMESVKKSIVLLQLAKRAVSKNAQPVMMETDNEDDHIVYANNDEVINAEMNALSIKGDHESSASSSSEEPEELEQGGGDLSVTADNKIAVNLSPVKLEQVPPVSYSSSDDEMDDFYDADEMVTTTSTQGATTADITEDKASLNSSETSSVAKLAPVEKVHYKDFFMDEEGEDGPSGGESVEEHKSVIMHLLSQVKLGMDLTKVVLPTFILERRSLLEMYADFFSHPDLFIDISRHSTPHARMKACLKFYLSTFSAGRDSSVAKKPYNPILGETFKCLYDMSDSRGEEFSYDESQSNDGPVPWATNNQLAFLAEQVSHHPPVSAFYAEHKASRIQFTGHIWTKSKFLGLSIGVHNIGQGVIRLLDLDEEYVINFPNGYGRSILTVPWVELGGDCTITCEKTGHSAHVKFHTKPFYGGRVHRVTAEVYAPDSPKKSYLSVDGEWNARMFGKEAGGKNECLFDAHTCKKFPKHVQSIEGQLETESRRMWRKVTDNLRVNNIDQATEGKRFLEDRQRKDARERAEKDVVYKPRLFVEDADMNWVYKSLLSDRG